MIHGAIDSFSRLIVYLKVSNNNRENTVLSAFTEAVREYGLPSRIRVDRGGENIRSQSTCYIILREAQEEAVSLLVVAYTISALRDFGGICTPAVFASFTISSTSLKIQVC